MNTFRLTFLPPKKKMSDFVTEVTAQTKEEANRIGREQADQMGFRNYRLANIKEKQ